VATNDFALVRLVMIIRDLVVDALRFIAASKGIVLAANIFGKLKTVFQMVAIPLVLLNGWPFSYFDLSWDPALRIASFFVYAATLASFLSGMIYFIQNRKVFKGGQQMSPVEEKAQKLLAVLNARKLSLGSIESLTGGLFASTICSIPGASNVFKGAIVSYANSIKTDLVGVKDYDIEVFGVVSSKVADEMAVEGRQEARR
jgi:hypothetical protein